MLEIKTGGGEKRETLTKGCVAVACTFGV